jgi:RNA polymerase sigma-70 factor (TIGR02943 family)
LNINSTKKKDLSTWVDLYSDDLLRWAEYKLSAKNIAEDLVQDCFMAAFQAYEKFEGRSNAKTWLFSILNRKIADYYRSHQSDFKNYASSDGHWENMDPDPIWEDEKSLLDRPDFHQKFQACLEDLPVLWREVIHSKYIQGLGGQEICQALDISTTNYWQITHRAKLLLKTCIETYWK